MLRSLVLLAAVVGLAAPLSAVVVSGGVDNDSGWWRDGQTAPWSFGVLDEDRDGRVSAGEMATAQRQFAIALKETKASLMAAVDLDQSGKMSRYEGAEGMKRWTSLRERAREMAIAANDKDHDGKLTGDESLGLERRIGQVFVRYGVAVVDTNRDKNFSRSEVEAAIRAIREGKGALFTMCDRSNDGMISVQEATMAFDLLAAAVGLQSY